jgi:hypothetical protein
MAAVSAIMEKKMKKNRECSPGSTPRDIRKKMGALRARTAPNTLWPCAHHTHPQC